MIYLNLQQRRYTLCCFKFCIRLSMYKVAGFWGNAGQRERRGVLNHKVCHFAKTSNSICINIHMSKQPSKICYDGSLSKKISVTCKCYKQSKNIGGGGHLVSFTAVFSRNWERTYVISAVKETMGHCTVKSSQLLPICINFASSFRSSYLFVLCFQPL